MTRFLLFLLNKGGLRLFLISDQITRFLLFLLNKGGLRLLLVSDQITKLLLVSGLGTRLLRGSRDGIKGDNLVYTRREFLIFELLYPLALFRRQEFFFFTGNSIYLNRRLTIISEIEGRRHGKSIKFKAGVDSITAQLGETYNNRVLIKAYNVQEQSFNIATHNYSDFGYMGNISGSSGLAVETLETTRVGERV